MGKRYWIKVSFFGLVLAYMTTGLAFYVAGSNSYWQLAVWLALWIPCTSFYRHTLDWRAGWDKHKGQRVIR